MQPPSVHVGITKDVWNDNSTRRTRIHRKPGRRMNVHKRARFSGVLGVSRVGIEQETGVVSVLQ